MLGFTETLKGVVEQSHATAHCQHLVRRLALAPAGDLHGSQRLQKFLSLEDLKIHSTPQDSIYSNSLRLRLVPTSHSSNDREQSTSSRQKLRRFDTDRRSGI